MVVLHYIIIFFLQSAFFDWFWRLSVCIVSLLDAEDDDNPDEDVQGFAEEPAEDGDVLDEEVQGSAQDTKEDNQAKEDDKAEET